MPIPLDADWKPDNIKLKRIEVRFLGKKNKTGFKWIGGFVRDYKAGNLNDNGKSMPHYVEYDDGDKSWCVACEVLSFLFVCPTAFTRACLFLAFVRCNLSKKRWRLEKPYKAVETAMLAFYQKHKPRAANEDDIELLLLAEETRRVNDLVALGLDLDAEFSGSTPDFTDEVLEPYAPADEGEL
jgi:hypothetical protein